jgi:hypothetical protein
LAGGQLKVIESKGRICSAVRSVTMAPQLNMRCAAQHDIIPPLASLPNVYKMRKRRVQHAHIPQGPSHPNSTCGKLCGLWRWVAANASSQLAG